MNTYNTLSKEKEVLEGLLQRIMWNVFIQDLLLNEFSNEYNNDFNHILLA